MRGLLLLMFVCVAYSQGTNATLEGQVTDPSGGVIAGAVVKAVSANTGVHANSDHDECGRVSSFAAGGAV